MKRESEGERALRAERCFVSVPLGVLMRRKLTAVHLKMRWIIFVAFAVPVFGRV